MVERRFLASANGVNV